MSKTAAKKSTPTPKSWAQQAFEYRMETRSRLIQAGHSAEGKALLAKIRKAAKEQIRLIDTGIGRHQALAATIMIDPVQPETGLIAFNMLTASLNADAAHPARHERGGEICERVLTGILVLVGQYLLHLRLVPGLRFFPHDLDKDDQIGY